jgi:hypothetical protein
VLGGLTSPAPTLEYLSLSQPDEPFGGLPHTFFGGATPRLSSLKLHNFNIGWESPFLKGLRHLEIHAPSAFVWTNVPQWLNALGEMSQLEKLVLHSSSLMANPPDIQRSISLPSLTHIDISIDAGNCELVLSYLSLPALTRLCVTFDSYFPTRTDIPTKFPSLSRHAHGPQDTAPLQSILVSCEKTRATILAWSAPDIDIDAHDPFTLLSVALSARVVLSITRDGFSRRDVFGYSRNRDILDRAMMALPLESIVTFTAQHRSRLDDMFWLCYAPKSLQCVRLTNSEARGFIEMLLQDHGGREHPPVPSLTKLVLIDVVLSARRTDRLCDVLMKRVEEGVPLETLDLRTCHATSFAVRLLSEIVVDVWGPAEANETKGVSRAELDTTGEHFVPDRDYSNASDSSSSASSSDENMAWEEAEVSFEDEGEDDEGEDYSDMEDD